MAKIWCDETVCWYNRKSKCKARDVFIFDGECIACRYTKPAKGDKRKCRDSHEVYLDRQAKRVSDKIRMGMMAMVEKGEAKGETEG